MSQTPVSGTVVIGARVRVADAEKFDEQARRYGLSRSAAAAALITVHALLAEQEGESADREQEQE